MTFLADAFYGGKNLVGCASSASIFHWSWAWLLLPLLATVQTRMVKTPGEKKPPGLQSGHCWLPKRIMSCFSKRWSSAYYVEVTASSLLTWSSCSVAAERREWFWLLGQQNRLPRRKGAWRFPWNKESRMVTRSRGSKAWWAEVTASGSTLSGTWRAGPAWSSLSPQDGWLSSHPFNTCPH